MVICLVVNAVFWLNAFPPSDGISDSLSLQYLLTGKHLSRRTPDEERVRALSES